MPHGRTRARLPVGLAAVLLLIAATAVSAQGVRPPIAEYSEKASGKFELVNRSPYPLNVVLEPRSLGVTPEGKQELRPLDPELGLKLSAMSFRIPPQQSYIVYYEARPEIIPAAFVIYAAFSGLPKRQGMNIQIELPHSVYIYQKESLREEDVVVEKAEYDAVAHRLRLEVLNTGPRLGRAQRVELRSGRAHQQAGGLPLFPGGRRQLEIPWEGELPPAELTLHFEKFRVHRDLAVLLAR